MTHALREGFHVPSSAHVTKVVSGTNPTSQTRTPEESMVERLPSKRRPMGTSIGLHSEMNVVTATLLNKIWCCFKLPTLAKPA